MFNPTRHHNLTSRHLNAAHREATVAEFFSLWKAAVKLAGERFFGTGRLADAMLATNTDELRPNVPLILQTIEMLQPTEQIFLASLLSFFAPTEGGLLLRKLDVNSLADYRSMSFEQRTLLAGLFLHDIGV